jgi:hypothetical protein
LGLQTVLSANRRGTAVNLSTALFWSARLERQSARGKQGVHAQSKTKPSWQAARVFTVIAGPPKLPDFRDGKVDAAALGRGGCRSSQFDYGCTLACQSSGPKDLFPTIVGVSRLLGASMPEKSLSLASSPRHRSKSISIREFSGTDGAAKEPDESDEKDEKGGMRKVSGGFAIRPGRE